MNKQLAKITKAYLGIKDRGIFHFWIHVDYEEGCSQGIGGYALDTYDEKLKRRVGSAYGCEMIIQLLKVLDVDDLSEAKGKMIWVLGEGKGFGFKPKGLESLSVDGKKRTLVFDKVLEECESRLKSESKNEREK